MLLSIAVSLLNLERLERLADNFSSLQSEVTGKLVDIFSSILSVRLFSHQLEEKVSISEAYEAAVKAEQKQHWTYFWIWTYYAVSFLTMEGLCLYFLMKGYREGTITLGDFGLILPLNISMGEILWWVNNDFSKFTQNLGRISQALRFIDQPIEIQDSPQAKDLIIKEGSIIFDNVHFVYKDSEPLFENKSVIIPAGQKVGLVGYSGGGKTTFVNLILRLFDVTEGKILIDGQDIRTVKQSSLRANIGIVPQDPLLFHRTLMENIHYGKLTATEKEVMEAACKAKADEFIQELPLGYQSMVGERGVKLSGGQRQRIAIARAILKNAPIFILDEATSQLDSVTESLIQESLWELMQDKTTIVIAHRLSTLLHMDRILVFNQGKIIEDGSHAELLARRGIYKTLWDTQVGGFLQER